jgi:hypothetical protein
MTENKKTARGLEEVSHFFLSRHSTEGGSEEVAEKKASRAASPTAQPSERQDHSKMESPSKTEHLQLKSAYEVDVAGIPSSALLRAAKKYLLRADVEKVFFAVDNIESPRFGASDLLFVNKTRSRVVCAKLARGKDCEAFVVSGVAFYFWLKEMMQVGASLFGHRLTLDMVLFYHGFSPAVSYLNNRWLQNARIRPIEYNVFRIEGLKHPVVRFRPVRTHRLAERRKENPPLQNDKAERNIKHQYSEPQDNAHQDWQAFQRLKERERHFF